MREADQLGDQTRHHLRPEAVTVSAFELFRARADRLFTKFDQMAELAVQEGVLQAPLDSHQKTARILQGSVGRAQEQTDEGRKAGSLRRLLALQIEWIGKFLEHPEVRKRSEMNGRIAEKLKEVRTSASDVLRLNQEVELLNCSAIARNVMDNFKNRYPDICCGLKDPELGFFYAPPESAKQAIEEMMEFSAQAIRQRPEGFEGKIKISFYADRNYCQMTIADNGVVWSYETLREILSVQQLINHPDQPPLRKLIEMIEACRGAIEMRPGSDQSEDWNTITIYLPVPQH